MRCPKCSKKTSISEATECKWCKKEYCMYCLLPEKHDCSQLEEIREQKKLLLGEQLVKIEKDKINF